MRKHVSVVEIEISSFADIVVGLDHLDAVVEDELHVHLAVPLLPAGIDRLVVPGRNARTKEIRTPVRVVDMGDIHIADLVRRAVVDIQPALEGSGIEGLSTEHECSDGNSTKELYHLISSSK